MGEKLVTTKDWIAYQFNTVLIFGKHMKKYYLDRNQVDSLSSIKGINEKRADLLFLWVKIKSN